MIKINMEVEKVVHWCIWTLAIVYSLLKFHIATEKHYNMSPDDFKDGWHILTYYKDNSDLEWVVLTKTFKNIWLFLAGQVFISQIISNLKIRPLFYVLFSVFCLNYIMGVWSTAAFIVYPALMFTAHTFGRKDVCYILTVVALVMLHHPSFSFIKEWMSMSEEKSFTFDVGLGWMMAKTLSFSIDRINSKQHAQITIADITHVMAYCMYLPVVFTGPILPFDTFCNQMLSTSNTSSSSFLHRLFHLFYQFVWFFVYELFLHYIFSSAVQFYPSVVESLDGWALCGLGYALPMMFYLKYRVIYGVAGAIASLEGFEFPPPPKCISAVHLSSFLWRHFDRGLYFWILRYLYHPLMGSCCNFQRKTFALFVCFGFMSLWHGMDRAVCTWSAMNCILVITEMFAQLLRSTTMGKYLQSLSATRKKRVWALISTPHFIMMCISCSFFLSNWEIGMILIERVLLGGITPLMPLVLVMYCGCHVSMDAKNYQLKV